MTPLDYRQFAIENARAEFGPQKTVCAWCGALIHAGPTTPVSHGLCPPCSAKLVNTEATA